MSKFFGILGALFLGIGVLAVSIVQVRGALPGVPKPETAGISTQGELGIYLGDPGYFWEVIGQRFQDTMTFDQRAKTALKLSLSGQRALKAEEILSGQRWALGLWTMRKALVYQTEAVAILDGLDRETNKDLAEELRQQASLYQVKLLELSTSIPAEYYPEVELLKTKAGDNFQKAVSFLAQ